MHRHVLGRFRILHLEVPPFMLLFGSRSGFSEAKRTRWLIDHFSICVTSLDCYISSSVASRINCPNCSSSSSCHLHPQFMQWCCPSWSTFRSHGAPHCGQELSGQSIS